MQIAGRFTNDRLELTQLTAQGRRRHGQAQGSIGLAADSGFPIDLARDAQQCAARRAATRSAATATGTIHLTNGTRRRADPGRPAASPTRATRSSARAQAEVPELTGVRRKSEIRDARPTDRPAARRRACSSSTCASAPPTSCSSSGMGLESEWAMDMRVGGTSAAPIDHRRRWTSCAAPIPSRASASTSTAARSASAAAR